MKIDHKIESDPYSLVFFFFFFFLSRLYFMIRLFWLKHRVSLESQHLNHYQMFIFTDRRS